MYELYYMNPKKWTPRRLASLFKVRLENTIGIIILKERERQMEKEEGLLFSDAGDFMADYFFGGYRLERVLFERIPDLKLAKKIIDERKRIYDEQQVALKATHNDFLERKHRFRQLLKFFDLMAEFQKIGSELIVKNKFNTNLLDNYTGTEGAKMVFNEMVQQPSNDIITRDQLMKALTARRAKARSTRPPKGGAKPGAKKDDKKGGKQTTAKAPAKLKAERSTFGDDSVKLAVEEEYFYKDKEEDLIVTPERDLLGNKVEKLRQELADIENRTRGFPMDKDLGLKYLVDPEDEIITEDEKTGKKMIVHRHVPNARRNNILLYDFGKLRNDRSKIMFKNRRIVIKQSNGAIRPPTKKEIYKIFGS